MSITPQKKAWLSSLGDPTWLDPVSGHITGAEEILGKRYSPSNLMGAYEDMFSLGWVRIDVDGIYLNFNMGGSIPKPSQLQWLKKTAMERQLILFNLDTRTEVDLED